MKVMDEQQCAKESTRDLGSPQPRGVTIHLYLNLQSVQEACQLSIHPAEKDSFETEDT